MIFSADSGSSWQRSSAPIRDHLGSLALPIFNRSSSVQGSADRLHFGIFWGRAVRFLVVTADVVLDYLLVFIGFPDRGTWQGSKLRSFGQVPACVAMSLPRFELARKGATAGRTSQPAGPSGPLLPRRNYRSNPPSLAARSRQPFDYQVVSTVPFNLCRPALAWQLRPQRRRPFFRPARPSLVQVLASPYSGTIPSRRLQDMAPIRPGQDGFFVLSCCHLHRSGIEWQSPPVSWRRFPQPAHSASRLGAL